MDSLKPIIGKAVRTVEHVEKSYAQLVFGKESRLTIYNRFSGDLDAILGGIVVGHADSSESLEPRFDNGPTISIGLRDEDDLGPESYAFFDHSVGIEFVNQYQHGARLRRPVEER